MFKRDKLGGHARRLGFACGVLFILAGLVYLAVSYWESIAQSVYIPFSRMISGLLGFVFSFIPLSVAELVLYALLLGFLVYFIVAVVQAVRRRNPFGLLRWLLDTVGCLVILGSLFMIFWGGNYFTVKMDEKLGLDVRDRPQEALVATAYWLLDQVNETAPLVPRDADGVMTLEALGFDELGRQAVAVMEQLQADYPDAFGGAIISAPKPVLASIPMSYTGITGIYIPLTGESNINTNNVDSRLPCTMLHEMAHRLGCAAEEDANFVAYAAGWDSGNPLFQYSGALLAFDYAYGRLTDVAVREDLLSRLHADVRADRADGAAHYNSYAGAVMQVSTAVNDGYLKTVSQSAGVLSYGNMVDLLVARYVKEHGEVGLE